MCNLCENFQKNAQHLAERADHLIGQWTGSRLNYSEAVTHAMAQLVFALRQASEDANEATHANLETSLSLFDRALSNCMLENQQEVCSRDEQELVTKSMVFDALVDQCIDGLGGLVPGHQVTSDTVTESKQVH